MSDFTLKTPTQEPGYETAMEVVFQWNYDPEVEELRNLYVKAAEAQWIGARDIEWERPIDLVKFSTTPLGAGLPIERTSYWRSLPQDTVVELTRRTASFRLSQFLHGEQGALMVAAQLVNAVPHTDAKFYAATQTMDEARHVEVFARYIEKLDEIRPIAPSLKGILDQTLETGDWMKKLVGMQIVVEGLALYAFREMRNLTEEPLLKDLLTYVARDESRHHAYGVQYIERCVPCLSDAARTELEDFALECARSLIDRNAQGFFTTLLQIWSEIGIDPVAMLTSLQNEREELTRDLPRGRRLGPVQGFVIPTLRRCGLLSERVASHFHGFLRENFGANVAGADVGEFMQKLPDLPADTARWVLGELS
jgi:para-aminobenzoate N-oxygenase AurF